MIFNRQGRQERQEEPPGKCPLPAFPWRSWRPWRFISFQGDFAVRLADTTTCCMVKWGFAVCLYCKS